MDSDTVPLGGTVNMYSLDKDMVFYDKMDQYLSAKISCLSSYRVEHDFQKELKEVSAHLTKWPDDVLFEHANNNDPDAVLELAIRYLSGYGVFKKNYEGALYVLDALFDPQCDRYVGNNASPTHIVQAHSLAAYAHLHKFLASPAERTDIQRDERRFVRPETMRLGVGASPLAYFALAAHHANESVKLGLVSPATLLVGAKIREIGEVLGADVEQTVKHGKRFRPLWRATARRREEIFAEERKRQLKADKSPNEYVCALEGCGIRGEKKAALRACGGRCPMDLKPSYCSAACQKKDWPRHKPICKPNSEGKTPKFSDEDKPKALTFFELGDPEDGDVPEDEEEESIEEISTQAREAPHGPGRIIDIPAPGAPGGAIQCTSNTMDPESMRSFRDAVSERLQ
ncbi:uncharacterized protein B0H18DRAFT_1008070 [Fomitopsis serialis]|uniref:uncharacterized protein n=1 Tax=Fomitopsis serialis TaxID=139415 RepID=UPI002007A6FD|nr:uncharacterized protein B0H18DRAFT_1008070 [Neoantrodia serialis]KAH9925754.1 hypothetical protein B0H18DRAFT_1008070 [Neoantrodia serialis]